MSSLRLAAKDFKYLNTIMVHLNDIFLEVSEFSN